MTENAPLALIAMGSNLPLDGSPPARILGRAVAALANEGIAIRAISRFFATPCFPAGAGPDYVNAAIAVRTARPPADLLALLHGIEARFGRERQQRWGMRTLDLDLLAVGDLVLPDAATQQSWRALPPEDQRTQAPGEMILPHPRIQDRAFVLVPLADIAAGWRHPLLNRSVAEMCADLPEDMRAEVRPV